MGQPSWKRRLIVRVIAQRIRFTSSAAASATVREEADRTVSLVRSVAPEAVERPVHVPPMRGVDPDMQDWSLGELLAHNTIVNREMTRILRGLRAGTSVASDFDPKADVMPPAGVGVEAVEPFLASVAAHLEASGTGTLRDTGRYAHPIFGPLDAHGWHCVCGLHLQFHRKQAAVIVARLLAAS